MSVARAQRGLVVLCAIVVAVVGSASCDSSSHDQAAQLSAQTTPVGPKGSWEGTVDGTNAFIGLSSDGYEVSAYICDGKKLATWFRGLAGGGKPVLVDDKGDRLSVTLDAQQARGRFTDAAGHSFTFTARASQDPVLYRARGTVGKQPLVAGWVLGPNGQQRGAVSIGGNLGAAPVL